MRFIHYDEAKKAAISLVDECVRHDPQIERALTVSDLFGKLRLVLWGPAGVLATVREDLQGRLEQDCGPWWTGEVLILADTSDSDRNLWEEAWKDARRPTGADRLRVLERHRTRTAWFVDVGDPLWQAPEDGPPIVVFYSFKGGLGRSTALASFAMQRACSGERVSVVDFDLDGPGVGRLLAADEAGTTSPWGVVDYLLERAQGPVPLSDYYHSCARLAGAGQIVVLPAGSLTADYTDKLARVDLEERPRGVGSALVHLLEDIRKELDPQWILLDARTGVSEPAGQLLSGLAHLHVLFGTTSEQSWQGLRTVIDRLGRQRVLADQPQAEILLLQAMVPPTQEAARRAKESFTERARREFTELYYVEEPENPEDDRFWDVRDLDTEDAPHAPIPLRYDLRLADFRDILEVADILRDSSDYVSLATRITGRFEKEADA